MFKLTSKRLSGMFTRYAIQYTIQSNVVVNQKIRKNQLPEKIFWYQLISWLILIFYNMTNDHNISLQLVQYTYICSGTRAYFVVNYYQLVYPCKYVMLHIRLPDFTLYKLVVILILIHIYDIL